MLYIVDLVPYTNHTYVLSACTEAACTNSTQVTVTTLQDLPQGKCQFIVLFLLTCFYESSFIVVIVIIVLMVIVVMVIIVVIVVSAVNLLPI